MLDGVDNNETWLQTVVIFPSVDALQEFKLQTSTYSAEFGRSLGGVVNLQLKCGTNEFHGSVFEFKRNDAFDANNWFNNRAGRQKPDLSQNQFGATFGGPIIKDKTFFFADYQGLRITSGQTYLSTVPSLKMRQGDFSEINRVIYDPLTGQPFPGNIIPESRWDPASKNIMQQLYPEPNTAGSVGADRAAHQQLPDHPEPGARGQPVRRQGRPPAEPEQPLLRPLQLPEDAPLPARHAGARRRRRHLRRGRRQHQGPEPRRSTTRTPSARTLLNEFRFGWNSIKFFMTSIDYGENLAAAMGIPGINVNDVDVGDDPDRRSRTSGTWARTATSR